MALFGEKTFRHVGPLILKYRGKILAVPFRSSLKRKYTVKRHGLILSMKHRVPQSCGEDQSQLLVARVARIGPRYCSQRRYLRGRAEH
jgi:hypothetical protein